MVFYSPRPSIAIPEGNAVQHIWKSPNIEWSSTAFTDATTSDTITFQQQFDTTLKLAALLRTEFRLHRGDVVVLAINNFYLTPVLHHAILALGAVVSPANVAYTAPEYAHQILTAQPVLVVAESSVLAAAKQGAVLAKSRAQIAQFEHVVERIKSLMVSDAPKSEIVDVPSSHPAYYCFSSGTSGLPKCVVTSHTNIAVNMLQQADAGMGLCLPKVPLGALLPLSHIFGLQVYVWCSLYNGCNSVVFRKFILEDVLKGIVQHKIVCVAVVPPLVLALAQSPLVERYPITNSLRFAVSGAAPLSLGLVLQAEKRLPGLQIVQAYGQTESSPLSLGLVGTENVGKFDKSSAGWLIANTKARLVDPDTLKDVEDGAQGELWIKGPQVMQGYLGNSKATQQTLVNGWLRSGDVAVRSQDGQFTIVDRIKELIKSKGHQVAPAELEGILLGFEQVVDVAVIGVFNKERTSELARAYLVLSEGADVHKLVAEFNKQVSVHKRLWGGAVVVDAIPKSPSGKILRRLLRDTAHQHTPVGVIEPSKL